MIRDPEWKGWVALVCGGIALVAGVLTGDWTAAAVGVCLLVAVGGFLMFMRRRGL